MPDWREVHRELRGRKHVTLRLLWLEWKAEPPRRLGLQPVLLRTTTAGSASQEVVMRLELPRRGGSSSTSAATRCRSSTSRTGEVAQAEVFVAVLGCSGMLYVEATPDQDLANWLMAHVHAFEAYGGVTVATTPDNLKVGRDQSLLLRP